MFTKPSTKYTKAGRINIAYQVYGSGPIDIVYIPGWVSNIDWMWACEELRYFFEEIGKIGRLILFDKRGTGLSDRIVELSSLEDRMEDIRAVMDAVGSEKAVLFGHSEGGSVSAMFAATYPNRTIALITFGIFAKRRYAANYPWAPTDEERQKVYDMIEHNWGGGEMNLESLAPSKANDKIFMDWLANYFRSGASPSAALLLTKMNTEVDIIDILSSISVPTLIMQRTHDIDVKIEEGRFIAERIPNSKLVELEGNDHLFWIGNTDQVLKNIKSFLFDLKPRNSPEKKLYTIVVAKLYGHEDVNPDNKESLTEILQSFRGSFIQNKENVRVYTFEGPSKAAHFSLAILDYFNDHDRMVSIGIHIKEGAVDEDHYVSPETNNLLTALINAAQVNQILITQTVKYLLTGTGLNFAPFKSIIDITSKEHLNLYYIIHEIGDNRPITIQPGFANSTPFLENVLQSIEQNIGEESFGVEMLCKEIGISERQLQRKLKALTTKSPNQLISSVRLHRAKELLLENQLQIAEIAYQTGFTSPSYFSKSFKKEFGQTPTEFLQNAE